MKKRIRILALCAVLTALCACNKEEKPIETTSAAETTEAIPESIENGIVETTEIAEEAALEMQTGDFEIEEEDGVLSITLYRGTETDVTIPAEIGGKAVCGMSCKEYIERMRIYKAEEFLIFTDHDLNYISQETGFSDCSHLINVEVQTL